MSRAPRRLLLNDEGSSALHYLDLDVPSRSWTVSGPGRDLQPIGSERVLRSTPTGFVELELAGGRLGREVVVPGASGIESVRRLPNGHSVVLGNDADGIFLWELDAQGALLEGRQLSRTGLQKGRMLRLTSDDKLLFCSETKGRRSIHEADWRTGISTLFEVPDGVPADSMVKAVRVGRDRLVVSSGYAASLLLIDPVRGELSVSIGGKQQPEPPGLRRALSPHFFSGYQLLPTGDYLVANWQGHGPSHAGDGYQVLMYDSGGTLQWCFDQTEYPRMTSLNNVLSLDELDTARLHDERRGVLTPLL
ncbi:MAG TPA: hypothetical protein VIW29_16445 [Polyangiaceae bacterium]